MSKSLLYQKDILSILDLSLDEIQQVLSVAEKYKKTPPKNLLSGKVIANCFFEASTRTRLSFETAVFRMQGQVIGFANADNLSIKKGESLQDTMRMLDSYADLIVVRHPLEGSARLAATVCDKPVINAGDGANQHPTQALIDLFSIKETQAELSGLNVAIAGDLKFARTVQSLVQASHFFNMRLFFVCDEHSSLPEVTAEFLRNNGVRFSLHQSLEDILPKIDVLYMTRIQQERQLANKKTATLKLHANMLEKAKANLKILHPLPRLEEIDIAVDETPNAYYFQQAANAVCVRQALLSLILCQDVT